MLSLTLLPQHYLKITASQIISIYAVHENRLLHKKTARLQAPRFNSCHLLLMQYFISDYSDRLLSCICPACAVPEVPLPETGKMIGVGILQVVNRCSKPGSNPASHPANVSTLDLQVVQKLTRDVLEQASALPLWSQDYTQLSKGTFAGAISSVACDGLQIFTETMNRGVDQIATPPENCYVIGLPTKMEGEATWGLLPLSTNSIITLNKNVELFFRTSDISEITAAVIPAAQLEAYAEQVEWIDLPKVMKNIKPVERVDEGIGKQLFHALITGMHFHLENKDAISFPQMWKNFSDDLIATCLHTLVNVKSNTSPPYDQRIPRYIVNRVRDSTLSNAGMPLNISELCINLRVSRRTLNHAFIRALGITPVAYMRNVRLHQVRAEILQSPHKVSGIAHIASKWGFWHMSLFSRYYRELFGECPTDTLQRTKLEFGLT